MKILIINAVCGSGSTGRIVSDMWSILKNRGHQVKIAYGVGTATRVDAEDLIRINNKRGYYIHNIFSRITDRAGFFSKAQTKQLIRKIEEFKPDLIHLHNLHGYYIHIEVLFRYLSAANIPVIWTLHDCWAFTGHCVHFTYEKCNRWKTMCYDCPQKKTYPKSFFMDNSRENYSRKKDLFTSVGNMTIVTPSEWLAGLVRESFLCKYRVMCIHNGIDLKVFKPNQRSQDNK